MRSSQPVSYFPLTQLGDTSGQLALELAGSAGAVGVNGRKPNSYQLMKIENLLPHLTANSKDGFVYT